jgi:methanogenic corrinoid protein MtbC1
MNIDTELLKLDAEGLQRFKALQADAVSEVTKRFYATHGSAYAKFGECGREACREDLTFHLEFLRPVLEFGLLQPMVDYLCWLSSVLNARSIPADHLGLSLDWLAEFYESHMDGQNGAVVAAALHAGRDNFLAVGTRPMKPPTPPAAWPEATPFETALLTGNQREALAVVNRCIDNGQSLIEIEMHVIQPALYQIGEKWQANQVTVAQEHMATAIVQSVMTVGLLRSPPQTLINKRALLACVSGNNHAIGLRMVADAFQLGGWDVQYLGANVPTPALVSQALEWKPDLVGLSVSFPQQLPVVKAVIAELTERFGSNRPAIIIGGLAINRFNRLADVVGADACMPNAESALASANSMIRG